MYYTIIPYYVRFSAILLVCVDAPFKHTNQTYIL